MSTPLVKMIAEARAALSSGQQELTPAQRAARRISLAEFVQVAWPIIEPSTPLIWSWSMQAIADHVQALLEGRLAHNNLAALVPPGTAKSTIASVCAPAWKWINHPGWRAIFASGNPSVATRDSLRCRQIIDSTWYPEDLAGHILSREAAQWEVLCIPQLWEESRRTTTSLGWTDPRKADGELMFPERFPQEVVDAERLRLGDSGFAGQHQQRPFDASGEVFKVGCLQSWDAPPPNFKRVIITLDTAFKAKETSDFSVGFVIGEFDRGYLLLERARGRYPYPTLRSVVGELAARWRASALLIEDAASGQSLIQDLRMNSSLPVVPVKPDGDKITRSHIVVPTWEAGRIFADPRAPWLAEFLEELHAFPKAAHDDQVDAFVQGVRYLSTRRKPTRIVPLYEVLGRG